MKKVSAEATHAVCDGVSRVPLDGAPADTSPT